MATSAVKVNEYDSHIKLAQFERSSVFWRELLDLGLPRYLENELEHEKQLEIYVNKVHKLYGGDYDKVVLSMPEVSFQIYDNIYTVEN